MPTENKLRVPPFTREDIKAMVEEMNDHVFIDLKGIDIDNYQDMDGYDNGETYQKLLNLPKNKIVVFTNFNYANTQFIKYSICKSLGQVEESEYINCCIEIFGDDLHSWIGNLLFTPEGYLQFVEG